MKLIEAMKKLKDLNIKAEDLRQKVGRHCADLNVETALYPDQKGTIDGWIQAHHDLLKEILRLRTAIQRTNIVTSVTIELGGVQVTKNIAEWIHRRRDLAKLEMAMWQQLGDRGLREGMAQNSQQQQIEIRIRRYFDPKLRDERLEQYRSEPSTIDGTLEVTNAVTDLME